MAGVVPRKLRLFVAAPEDLRVEREQVIRVADRINRRIEAQTGEVAFDVLDFSDHLTLNLGGAGREAHQTVPVAATDIFLGLAWLRFSEPAHGASSEQEYCYSSEDDFAVARDSWRAVPEAPRFFLRCQRLPERLKDIDGARLAQVDDFYASIGDGDGEFFGAAELEDMVERQLTSLLERAAEFAGTAPPPPSPPAASDQDVAEFERKMVPGRAYEVTFLSLEICGWAEIQDRHAVEETARLLAAFQRLVVETAKSYGGEIFRWEAGHGLLLFWQRRSFDQAIMTGLKVIHALPIFNLDPAQNPLPSKVEVAAAAHNAAIVFEIPRSAIESDDIHFVLALRGRTTPGELTVSKRLLDRADERLRPRFKARDRYENEPIFSCRLPASEERAVRTNLDELSRDSGEQISRIEQILGRPTDALDPGALAAVRAAVDEVYSLLDKACGVFGRVESSWSKELHGELAKKASELVEREATLWRTLRGSHQAHESVPAITGQIDAIVKAASSRRSRPAVTLARAEESLLARARGEAPEIFAPTQAGAPEIQAAPADDADLFKKIDALSKADLLDLETAMTDLLLGKKNELLAYLSASGDGDARRAALIEKLWKAADLLLIDDLYSIRGHRRATDHKVSDVLAAPPVSDGRFRVLREMLSIAAKPDDEMLHRTFSAAGAAIHDDDLQVVWRCLVLAHGEQEVRSHGAFQLSEISMWQAISLPNIPLASIYAIGERVGKAASDDTKKIFFDCVRSRIATAVESFKSRDELSYITKLILLLLDFPFLVETGYFERFDDILEGFLARAHQAGLKVDYFENLRSRLDTAHKDPENQKMSRPPAGIKQLPLTIQRRLAAEPQYVFWFVTHPDPRVAGETLRNINLSNVERVLKLPEVNQSVFMGLLKKPEYFTRSAPLLAALNNPKCDPQFASRYLGNLSRSRGGSKALEQISRNSSANPAVRGTAQRLLRSAQPRR